MLSGSEIETIKSIAIVDVLASRSIMPVSRSGNELAYCSPLRNDAKPSFYVNVRDNVFRDVVVSEHRGDVIRLVQLLDNDSFKDAIQTLLKFKVSENSPSFFLSGSLSTPATTNTKDKIREVKLLQNASLLRYVESRAISVSIARKYLREVHYNHNEKYLYAVGFKNDSDGYALRNGVGCKRNIGPTDVTTVNGTCPESSGCNVFEGFFDFLSALQYFEVTVPTYTTYIVNSVANVNRVLPYLHLYTSINVYFDRDKPGQDAFRTLQSHNKPVLDRSYLYIGHKDFNDFLQNITRPTH